MIRLRRSAKFSFWLIGIFIAINVLLGFITNVSTHVTESDRAVFRTTLGLSRPLGELTFDQEMTLIKNVQSLVLKAAPVGLPIPEFSDREPEDLFRQRSGLCYDRSRSYDKIFSWLGFESRHVYILYPERPGAKEILPYWRAFFARGTQSHAVTEVKTSRGWLVVDSNSVWSSVSTEGHPIDADRIYENAKNFADIPSYFNRPYWAIRGLYSRRGQFYRPYLPYPQLNWADFFAWHVEGWRKH